MSIAADRLEATPGQTIGPFFAFGLNYPGMHRIVFPYSPGAILLSGTIRDGAGAPIPDAVIEIWGADSDGSIPAARGSLKRDDHTFTGFGRAATTDEGRFEFWTREPGPRDERAPFFAVVLFARGLPDKLHTRIYLPDTEFIDDDPFLNTLSPAERSSLIATRTAEGQLAHDIHLQGERETVFLAY